QKGVSLSKSNIEFSNALVKWNPEIINAFIITLDTNILNTTFNHSFFTKVKEPVLMLAMKKNDNKIIEALIQKKINLDVIGHDGNTALMTAVLNNNIKIAVALIKAKANLELKDKN